MEKTLVIMMGVQGSGKSTFYRKFLSDNFVRVNLDTLKTRNREKLIIEKCLTEGHSYAIDNTNPAKSDRQRYIPDAKANGYRVVGYYMGCDLVQCIARNNMREGKERIPEKGIYATLGKLERPSYDEGFDELYYVKNDGETMTVEKWKEDTEV